MLVDIVHVEAREPYKLHLRFADGVAGTIDLERLIRFDGIFAPLTSPEVLAAVRLNADLGTIVWPNGADLDPAVLYAVVRGDWTTSSPSS